MNNQPYLWPWLRGRKHAARQPAGDPAATPARPVRDPLVAIPVRPENVELRRDPAGCLHLRVHLRVNGWRARVGRWLHYDHYRTAVLDADGTRFYDLADGERTLRTVAGELAALRNRSVPESEQAVILYTRDLMRRGFLSLKLLMPQVGVPFAGSATHPRHMGDAV